VDHPGERRRLRADAADRDLSRHRRSTDPGYRGIELLRRNEREPVEFVTLMWFDSLEDVRVFAGPDYETAVVPPAARALLLRFDDHSAHYEVRQPRAMP